MIEGAGVVGIDVPTLAARVTVTASEMTAALAGDADILTVGRDPASVLSRTALSGLRESTLAQLDAFHRANPLKTALSREALRRQVFGRVPEGALDHVIGELAAEGMLRVSSEAVSLARHEVRLSPEEERARRELLEAARSAGLEGIDPRRVAEAASADPRLVERVARVLQDDGRLRRVGDSVLVDRDHLETLKADVRRRWPPGSRLDVTAFKDMTGLSRKFVIPLLEFLDREKVTRRAGSDRLVLA